MTSDDIITTTKECPACAGSGYSGPDCTPQQCYNCGGNGKTISFKSYGQLQNDMFEMLVDSIGLNHCDGARIVDALIDNEDFVDKLLERIGRKMEPDDAVDENG
jgi:RecJ-like exonuclease